MHKQSPRSIYAKLSTVPFETLSAKLTLSTSASDATYYDIEITDENGATISKSGGEALLNRLQFPAFRIC